MTLGLHIFAGTSIINRLPAGTRLCYNLVSSNEILTTMALSFIAGVTIVVLVVAQYVNNDNPVVVCLGGRTKYFFRKCHSCRKSRSCVLKT